MAESVRAGALITFVEQDLCDEDEIRVEGSVVKIIKMGVTVSAIEIDEKVVDHALFTYFDGQKTLVVVAGDMLYTLGKRAKRCTMTLPFVPSKVLPCSKGLVLVSDSKLYLMTDPLRLLGLIVPSSTSTVDANAEALYFGDQDCSLAVFKDGDHCVIYSIRYLSQRKRAYKTRSRSRTSTDRISHASRVSKRLPSGRLSGKRSRLSDRFSDRMSDRLSFSVLTDEAFTLPDVLLEDFEYEREAIISLVHRFSLGENASLQVFPQRLRDMQSLSIMDMANSTLHHLRFSRGNSFETIETVRAQQVVPLQHYKVGDQAYPFLAVLVDGKVQLCSSVFSSQHRQMPLPPVTEISTLPSPNSFRYRCDQWQRVELAQVTCPLVVQCFELLALISEPEILSGMVLDFIFNATFSSQWSVFESIVVSRIAEFPKPPQAGWLKLAVELQTEIKLKGPDLIIYLHLLREDMMLRARSSQNIKRLGHLLSCLTTWSGWTWNTYYRGDAVPLDLEEDVKIELSQVPGRLPVIFESFVSNIQPPQIPYPDTSSAKQAFYHTNVCKLFFETLSAQDTTVSKMMQLLKAIGLTPALLETFSIGPRFCITEVLGYLQIEAGESEFYLLDRRDLVATLEGQRVKSAENAAEHLDDNLSVTRLIFGQDRRFYEVVQLLQTTKSQQCDLIQPHDVTEHVWLEMQQGLAQTVAVRTLSAAYGRAAVYFGSCIPIVSERLEFPELQFDVFLREHNVSVVFSPDNLRESTRTWGYLAHGVATGLSISRDASVNSYWIVYNNSQDPAVPPAQHAGFLLGLGIVGHLKTLEEWHIYHYLGQKDPVMSNALLLGLAASHLGTMNSKLTKVLSVHICALLPLGSSDLNVAPEIQTAAIVAMGLLYMETQNRRMSEVMLSELRSTAEDRDEIYRTACGISLGMINLGKGQDLCGLFDVQVVEKLQAASAVQSDAGPWSPIQLSQNGALLALMLMFLGTNDAAVAASLKCPTSAFLADYTRPDVLYTRSMAHNLILLNSIEPTRKWVTSQIPPALFRDIAEIKEHDSDLLPFYHILGGALVSMGIKYAGTGEPAALDTLLYYIDEFRRLCGLPCGTVDAKICQSGLSALQSRLVAAAAMVAAGRGTVSVLQRLRPLYAPSASDTTYDEFVGISMAIGILFLGGGQYSFSRSPRSLGCLAISLLSLAGAGGEASAWEHLRFFWGFATQKRCLVARDVDSHVPVKVNVDITLKTGKVAEEHTPFLLPPVEEISTLAINDRIFLPINVPLDGALAAKIFETNTVFVQKARSVAVGLADRLAGRSVPRGAESAGDFLDILAAQASKRPEYLWNLKLLLVFAESWRPDEELRFIPRRRLDKVKVQIRTLGRPRSTLFD